MSRSARLAFQARRLAGYSLVVKEMRVAGYGGRCDLGLRSLSMPFGCVKRGFHPSRRRRAHQPDASRSQSARRSRRAVLPAELRGISATTICVAGVAGKVLLVAALRASRSSSLSPSTTAHSSSKPDAPTSPVTAARRTPGCRSSQFSTRSGETFCPPILMRLSTRPLM